MGSHRRRCEGVFCSLSHGLYALLVALLQKGATQPLHCGGLDGHFMVGGAGFHDCAAMGNHTRLSLAPALRTGPSREFCLCDSLPLIVPGPQFLVYILLAPASCALEVEAAST